MAGQNERIEYFPGNNMEDSYYPSKSGKSSRRRLIVFLLTFLICFVFGQIYNFQRPAVYQSNASLLTTALPDHDQPVLEADNQHVMLQRQKMLGKPILEELASRLNSEGISSDGSELNIYQLQSMISVEPIPETNLVGLQAEGGDPNLLAVVVNSWIKSYLDFRANEEKILIEKTTGSLQKKLAGIRVNLDQKRKRLEVFRQENEILSLGREENQVLAKLKGLSDALNKANEEKIKTKARLDAIFSAIKDGKIVVPEEDKRSLAVMEQRAQQLREQLAELDSRFTRSYIALSPKYSVVPEKLKELEAKIESAHKSGRAIATNIAQQDYAAAKITAEELQKQLSEHKRLATEFTSRFAEHESMKDDLASLEELYREVESRLVKIESENRQKYPQVKVVEWAFSPDSPIRPNYIRDAIIIFGASLVISLIMVLLTDFLAPKEHVGPTIIPGVAVYPGANTEALGQRAAINHLEDDSSPALVYQQSELKNSEIANFISDTDSTAKLFCVLLLHGLTVDEIRQLVLDDYDSESGYLYLRGQSPRKTKLSITAIEEFENSNSLFTDWIDKDGLLPEKSDLDARVKMAAADAGLDRWQEVDTNLFRHTYIIYLVKQGIKFSDLERVVGMISPQSQMEYRAFSPSGAGLPLDEINTIYPIDEGNGDLDQNA